MWLPTPVSTRMFLPSLRSSQVWIAELTIRVPGSTKCGSSQEECSSHVRGELSGKNVSGVISTGP
ncbi:hypothetical protein ACFQQB_55440 [Nonomuraea rubra]|uniref:hypothetical protein n=1 Tax=Nonomuraea rubra TaxID=46180 RepID=UPI00360A09BC